MKRKIYYLAMMLILILAAICLWAYAPVLAAAIGCNGSLPDIVSAVILAVAFYPSGKFCECCKESKTARL